MQSFHRRPEVGLFIEDQKTSSFSQKKLKVVLSLKKSRMQSFHRRRPEGGLLIGEEKNVFVPFFLPSSSHSKRWSTFKRNEGGLLIEDKKVVFSQIQKLVFLQKRKILIEKSKGGRAIKSGQKVVFSLKKSRIWS